MSDEYGMQDMCGCMPSTLMSPMNAVMHTACKKVDSTKYGSIDVHVPMHVLIPQTRTYSYLIGHCPGVKISLQVSGGVKINLGLGCGMLRAAWSD